MMARIGIDVGGSGVRASRVASEAADAMVSVPIIDRSVDAVVHAIVGAARAARLGAEPIGVGVPGFVSDGVVLGSPNFPGWSRVPLRDRLEDALGVPVAVDNDANCAALGAWAARGRCEDLVLLTLGTGVGGGVISEGRLLRGATGVGAEVGHLYAGGEQPCGCGGRGCLETWVGTEGMRWRAAARGYAAPDGRAIVEAARAGEAWATAMLEEAAAGLGRGLVTLVNLFNPDVVMITGGLASARDLLEPLALAGLRRDGIRPSVSHVRVVWEGRADAFAILGAAELAAEFE